VIEEHAGAEGDPEVLELDDGAGSYLVRLSP